MPTATTARYNAHMRAALAEQVLFSRLSAARAKAAAARLELGDDFSSRIIARACAGPIPTEQRRALAVRWGRAA